MKRAAGVAAAGAVLVSLKIPSVAPPPRATPDDVYYRLGIFCLSHRKIFTTREGYTRDQAYSLATIQCRFCRIPHPLIGYDEALRHGLFWGDEIRMVPVETVRC